jgi:methylmalonyl-CoA mutase N-terminal domain/subunit
MLEAIESGWVVQQISDEAFRFQQEVEQGKRVVVGVNRFATEAPRPFLGHHSDPQVAHRVNAELKSLRRQRDGRALSQALRDLKADADNGKNLMPSSLAAIKAQATVGEVSGVLRETFGEWRAPTVA